MKVETVFAKHELLSRILIANGTDKLPKDLRLKIISARIEYGKIVRQYKADFDEFAETLKTDEVKQLVEKKDKLPFEERKMQDMIDDINDSYAEYVAKRTTEETDVNDITLSETEVDDIAIVNVNNNVNINGTEISASDFLELIIEHFC